MPLILLNETLRAHLCGNDETRGGRRWEGWRGQTDRGEDEADALNWRSDERTGRRREFRAALSLHTTEHWRRRQTNSPGDRAVCLLIISGQDEPSSAVRVCVREGEREKKRERETTEL